MPLALPGTAPTLPGILVEEVQSRNGVPRVTEACKTRPFKELDTPSRRIRPAVVKPTDGGPRVPRSPKDGIDAGRHFI